MSVVSGEGLQSMACSSGKEKKHVVIYYPRNGIHAKGMLVSVPIDTLIPHEHETSTPYCTESEQELPCSEGVYLEYSMSCICTPTTPTGVGPGLYFFGGEDTPPETWNYRLLNENVLKEVYRYDLHELPKIGSMIRCKDMVSGMSKPLLAQIGDDCIYVLGHGKTQDKDSLLKHTFQAYNFKKDTWTLVTDDDLFGDMINKADCNKLVRGFVRVPHVVIGRKLHVSLGNSSFTFDSVKCAWEDCKLFKTFWSEQRRKKSGLSPSNFYGRRVCVEAAELAEKNKNKKRKKLSFGGVGGPPFGFFGRGILWDKNILLGLHHIDNCPVVAFLLDDDGRVVKSQPVSLNNLAMDGGLLRYGACLVDLGRDGYFGLVHTLFDKRIFSYDDYGNTLHMELVTLQFSRTLPKETDDGDDHFVDCRVVDKKIVAENCPDSVGDYYNAFCV